MRQDVNDRAAEQAVAPDASIAWLSSNFLALEVEWLSLGAGEQQRYASLILQTFVEQKL